MSKRPTISTLILLRHGQSVWNGSEARFTGWCDVPLTVKGRVEAVAAGQLLRSRGFRASKVDVAFTSEVISLVLPPSFPSSFTHAVTHSLPHTVTAGTRDL